MPRIPLGEEPEYSNASQGIYRFGERNRGKVVRVSRRRPEGLYSLLGVACTASKNEINAAFRRLALKCHPDKTPHLDWRARASATKRFKELSTAREVLTDDCARTQYDRRELGHATHVLETSTARVRKHRKSRCSFERRVDSAIETARQRLENGRFARRSVNLGTKGAKFKLLRRVNTNNRYTRSQWIVLQRTRAERKKNRRLRSKFVVQTKEEAKP